MKPRTKTCSVLKTKIILYFFALRWYSYHRSFLTSTPSHVFGLRQDLCRSVNKRKKQSNLEINQKLRSDQWDTIYRRWKERRFYLYWKQKISRHGPQLRMQILAVYIIRESILTTIGIDIATIFSNFASVSEASGIT